MKKIPTLFKRVFSEDHKTKTILPEVTQGCEIALDGKCTPTVKWDGACCAIINGDIYKRYDAKHGKKPPEGAIPCQPEPDPITTHWPHWVKCVERNPSDKYFLEAYRNWEMCGDGYLLDGHQITTMEAIGPHWQSNPYHRERDVLVRHGVDVIPLMDLVHDPHVGYEGEPTFITLDSIKAYLKVTPIEGIVFWYNGEPLCKIKRSDFGFEWPIKETD